MECYEHTIKNIRGNIDLFYNFLPSTAEELMNAKLKKIITIATTMLAVACLTPNSWADTDWADDLTAISENDWSYEKARHLVERAGFGDIPINIERLATMGPRAAVRELVYFHSIPSTLPDFDHSGIHDSGIEPFPASRPAATKLAKETGEAIGVKVKPEGNRRLQPVVDRFFYWLRSSMLETRRVAHWWANRMLLTKRPLEEKMTLFWHGHFATNEEKVRDYRKLLNQNQVFRAHGTGNFKDLLIAVSQDPAMLAFLDAGVNIKGSPNENFAREIMELFTMGVGNYSEQDIREAARAFTGWNFTDLQFVVNASEHDASNKTFLGRTGAWDGLDIIDMILEKPVTAEYIAGKIYKFFVREEITPELQKELGASFYSSGYEITPLLEKIFLSKDFYSPASMGTHIKSPVELVISTYKKLGLDVVPGVPDFYDTTESLGQILLFPPTVAGWAGGRSWITPGLLLARGNFVYDTVFPNINFLPSDRYPENYQIGVVAERLATGADIATATQPEDSYATSASNNMVDRDEEFNTRLGSYRGWRMAIERVKPISRTPARLNLTKMILAAKCTNTEEVVDYLSKRFFTISIDQDTKKLIADFLEKQLGTNNIIDAQTFSEEAVRETFHLLLSLPEYQLG